MTRIHYHNFSVGPIEGMPGGWVIDKSGRCGPYLWHDGLWQTGACVRVPQAFQHGYYKSEAQAQATLLEWEKTVP